MKKLLCLVLFLALLCSCFSACSGKKDPVPNESQDITEQTTESVKPKSYKLSLGYYKDKSLIPFTTNSPTNKKLMTLVFDSLFVPTNGYDCEPLIAESYSLEGTTLTVELKSDIFFSDASAITASDVVYSFNEAKTGDNFKGLLSNFLAAQAMGDSVVFTLQKEDIFACSCLLFPIVKYGTAQQDFPIGSGRYTLSKAENSLLLKANDNSTRNEEMAVKEIELIPITSEKNELYLLQTGDLSYFFDDLTDGEYTKISANTKVINLNNLVYLGYNSSNPLFSDKNIINAVSLAINRKDIADSCYSGLGETTGLPFNSQWYLLDGIQLPDYNQNTATAYELLKKSGYKYEYSNNSYLSKNFDYLELTMIVNNENPTKLSAAKKIQSQLKAVGMNITLKEMDYEDYTDALYDGEFDLYIGEVKLSPDMDLSCFFDEGAAVGYGINSSSTCAEAFYDFMSGKIDITTFIQVFELEKPFVPILFRNAMAYYSRELTYQDSVNEYEPFLNIYSWGFTQS